MIIARARLTNEKPRRGEMIIARDGKTNENPEGVTQFLDSEKYIVIIVMPPRITSETLSKQPMATKPNDLQQPGLAGIAEEIARPIIFMR